MSKLNKRVLVTPISQVVDIKNDGAAATSRLGPLEEVELNWLVTPAHGASHWFDVRHLADGSARLRIAAQRDLISSLAPDIRLLSQGRSPGSVAAQINALNHFWRYLDRQKETGFILHDIGSLDDGDGLMFRSYLVHDSSSPAVAYRTITYMRRLLNLARRRFCLGAKDLLWPASKPREALVHKDVDPRIFKPLYNVLKAQYYSFIAIQRRGSELLKSGVDPRLIGDGNDRAVWSVEANVAVVTERFVQRACRQQTIWGKDVHKCFSNPTNFRLPSFGSPPLGEELKPFHRLRWFAPHPADTAACFFLVQMHFGWNVSTVRSIDVSSHQSWFEDRLQGTGASSREGAEDGTVAIYGYKNRSGKEQVAFSRKRPQHHPFRVLQTMLGATEKLREGLHERLTILQESTDRTRELELEISRLKVDLRSPWLCIPRVQGSSSSTRVAGLPTSILIKQFSRFCRLAYREALMMLLRRSGVRRKDGSIDRGVLRELRRPYLALRSLTPSDLRDGFASYVYDQSVANVFVVQRALGHQNLRSARHYLRQRRQLAERFGAFARFQEHLWDEIAVLKKVDPTVLFVRTATGEITPEQRQRLAAGRQLTRAGMGCLDPEHPPSEIAPDHSTGLCAVQRCVLCRHAIIFEASLDGLAIRMAELRQIRRQTAASRWVGSTFELEWISIDLIINRLFSERRDWFEEAVRCRAELLEGGRAYIFDQHPPSALSPAVS